MTPRHALTALAPPYPYQAVLDADGWPIIPGRLGRLEWHGAELAACTERSRLRSFRARSAPPAGGRWRVSPISAPLAPVWRWGRLFGRVEVDPRATAKGDDVRLVITRELQGIWVRLEPATAEERRALEACEAQGEGTSGRGVDAITRLRALAKRLGSPIKRPVELPPARAWLAVVQRGERDLYERLAPMAGPDVVMIWDRRQHERRTSDQPISTEQRRSDRRHPLPATWDTKRFLLVRLSDVPA
jgi:hypothetical protein